MKNLFLSIVFLICLFCTGDAYSQPAVEQCVQECAADFHHCDFRAIWRWTSCVWGCWGGPTAPQDSSLNYYMDFCEEVCEDNLYSDTEYCIKNFDWCISTC